MGKAAGSCSYRQRHPPRQRALKAGGMSAFCYRPGARGKTERLASGEPRRNSRRYLG